MSGRISDIAIHPSNENVWYVTVGSGGVWKTENAGTTWSAIFEKQTSYASGCVTLDPSNPENFKTAAQEIALQKVANEEQVRTINAMQRDVKAQKEVSEKLGLALSEARNEVQKTQTKFNKRIL